MKIYVSDGTHRFSMSFPTQLIFNRVSVKLLVRVCSLYITMEHIPSLSPEIIYALLEELKRIKRKYGTWELVNVESANGEVVKIVL